MKSERFAVFVIFFVFEDIQVAFVARFADMLLFDGLTDCASGFVAVCAVIETAGKMF